MICSLLMSTMTRIRSKAAPQQNSGWQVCKLQKKLYSFKRVFHFTLFCSTFRGDKTIPTFALRVSLTDCTHIEGVKFLFHIALHISMCRGRMSSCFHTNFLFRHFFTWFWTILANSLELCSIVGCRKHCYERSKTASDWGMQYKKMVKAFLTGCAFSHQFDWKILVLVLRLLSVALQKKITFPIKNRIKSWARISSTVKVRPSKISKLCHTRLVTYEKAWCWYVNNALTTTFLKILLHTLKMFRTHVRSISK